MLFYHNGCFMLQLCFPITSPFLGYTFFVRIQYISNRPFSTFVQHFNNAKLIFILKYFYPFYNSEEVFYCKKRGGWFLVVFTEEKVLKYRQR